MSDEEIGGYFCFLASRVATQYIVISTGYIGIAFAYFGSMPMTGDFFKRCFFIFALIIATWVAYLPEAFSRPITQGLRKAISLIQEHGSLDEAKALEKFFMIQGYEQIPLHKTFVDGSIGRDAVVFLDKQISRLEALQQQRPYLSSVIESLYQAKRDLEHHGYVNWGPQVPSSLSNGLVLGDYRFDRASYKRNMHILSGGKAIEFLKSYYQGLGLKVTLHEFQGGRGGKQYNIEVTIPGKTKNVIVLGAHYASGTAALMEAARAFRGLELEKTIRLVHFCKEKQPEILSRSRAYVKTATARGDVIDAAFILDAIVSNQDNSPRIFLHTNLDERSLFLGSEITRAASRINAALKPVAAISSDNTSFSVADTGAFAFVKKGIPTVFIKENLHSSIGSLTYAGTIVKSVLEAVARVACPTRVTGNIRLNDFAKASVFGWYRRSTSSQRGNVTRSEYDEMVDDKGNIRPGYQGVARYFAKKSKSNAQKIARAMQADAKDMTEFRAYPRVVDAKEFSHIERGLDQLERMFQVALQDIYSPRSQLIKAGVLTRAELGVTEDFDPWFVGRYGRRTRFDFILRPDLVRDEQGRLTVLEVNMGFVGGFADIVRTRKLMKQNNPRAFDEVSVQPTEDFLTQFAQGLKSLSQKKNPKIVYYTDGKLEYWSDKEDLAFKRELEKEGIEYVTSDTQKQLKTIRGRVYLVSSDGKRERVDIVYSRRDATPPEMQMAHANGGVVVFPTPSSAVLESKNIYRKLPQLIRVLLHEEPVFRFLESRSFARPDGKLDSEFMRQIFDNPKHWVIKAAIGAQGAGVLVGKDATPSELLAFRAKVLKNPAAWDAQEYVKPSTYNGERVDLNPFLVTIRGEKIIPKGAMVRTARLAKGKFGDDPKFMDVWVLDSSKPRDFLKKQKDPSRAKSNSSRTSQTLTRSKTAKWRPAFVARPVKDGRESIRTKRHVVP